MLTASPLILPNSDRIPWRKANFILALDNLKDPQNIGSLIRTAYFLGASCVVMSGTGKISPTISKASAGVTEAWPHVYQSHALHDDLASWRTSGGFAIVGASVSQSDSEPLEKKKRVLVMGGEHVGLSNRVLKECDRFVQIMPNLSGSFPLDSLNVSAAGAILINRLI